MVTGQFGRWLLLAGCALGCAGDDAATGASTDAGGEEVSDQRPRGHWYEARDSDDESGSEGGNAARAKALEAIGYASGMEAATDARGVLLHRVDEVSPGLSLYSSGHGPDAFLIEPTGDVVKRWSVDARKVWPEREYIFGYFRKVRLMQNGVLLAVFGGRGMAALAPNSKVLWTYDEPAHHDVRELADGTIYGLDRRARVMPEFHPSRPLLDDRIYFLDQDGQLLGRVSILESLMNSEYADDVRRLVEEGIERGTGLEKKAKEIYADRFAEDPTLIDKLDMIGDIFHCNSARVIDASAAAAIDEFEDGWYLVSIRELSALVAIEVDDELSRGVARWWKRGPWKKQHEATALANGSILMFDNEGAGEAKSRVIEVDPTSGEIVWSYEGPPGVGFFSRVGGSCHRLENGNTLVVESTAGMAYEVKRDGTCVWTFASPHRAGEDGELVAFLPDVERVEER